MNEIFNMSHAKLLFSYLKNLKTKWRVQNSDGTKYGQEGKCKWIDPTLG